MTVLQYEIKTCSYKQFRPEMGLPIRASLGGPRWWKGGIPAQQVMLEIAPHRSYFNEKSDAVFEMRFREQLDRFGIDHLIQRFNEIGQACGIEPGGVLVPMCFEQVRTWESKVCHRAMFRHWWLEQTGERLVELGLPADTPNTPPQGTLDLDM